MRILFVNDGIGDAGGVQSYLSRVIPGLAARGHAVALLHLDPARPGAPSPAPGAPHFCLAGGSAALDAALGWRPDVVFSHNMRVLETERALLAARPVVKFMHGYFGTCIGGQKAHLFPEPVPCHRPLGAACLALYGPRRCGRLSLPHAAAHWRWAHEQRALFGDYAAMVVASDHMREEYLRNGAVPDRVHSSPLFPTVERAAPAGSAPGEPRVVFVGRMTTLKGGGLLIEAVQRAERLLGRRIPLEMIGDGPQRADWMRRAQGRGLLAEFPGWVDAEERDRRVRAASLAAVPSVWPEPFGLVGLEAAALGVPAVAFDVGGVREWLREGVSGHLAPADPPQPEGLAAAIARALADDAHHQSLRRGALRVAGELTLDRHLARLEGILAAAAGRAA